MFRLLPFCLLLAFAPASFAQDLQTLADRLVEAGSPGAVVMRISVESEEIAVAGVRAAGDDTAISIEDAWHLGSNTKAMTAILAARLVEQDRISWEAELGAYLADGYGEIDPELADATLIGLLSHMSGMQANAGRVTMISLSGADADRDARLDRISYLDSVLDEAGGSRGQFLYSNAGYVAAAAMMEEATGETWEALIQSELFDVLGLESAGFGPPEVTQNPQGHRNSWGRLAAVGEGAGADNPVALNPAGRVHMSMADYAIFLRLVMRGARGEETDYLTRDSWQLLITPPHGGNYALGWGVQPDGALSHAGSNTMWFLQAIIWTDDAIAAVAAVNEGRANRVAPATGNALLALSPN